jgi:hypothetical protein
LESDLLTKGKPEFILSSTDFVAMACCRYKICSGGDKKSSAIPLSASDSYYALRRMFFSSIN